MKYILNEIPVRTTNNFHINDLKVDLELPTNLDFHDYVTNNIEGIKVEYSLLDNFTSKIGLEFSKAKSIDITIKDKISEPIEFIYEFSKNDTLIDNININFLEDSNANIIFKYISLDEGKQFHHLKQIINVSKNSKANITNINLMNSNSINIIASESNVSSYGELTNNLVDISGSIRIYNYDSICEDNAKSYLNNIYIGKDKEIIDMNYRYVNKGVNSITNIESQGVLDNEVTKNFRGTIDFVSGCTGSQGRENENTVLLSDTCICRSVPILLCGEENVEGSHSVSSGKIDDTKLFYLMSRGISEEESKKLIILANFDKVLFGLDNDELKEELVEIINNRC